MPRLVRCKPKHFPQSRQGDRAVYRKTSTDRSTCPKWAMDKGLQQQLIDKALVDPNEDLDSYSNPQVLWNYHNGDFFIGRSSNTSDGHYSCYPELPDDETIYTKLVEQAKCSSK